MKSASIPHEKLLNQSFRDQLNSLQILEQLALLELAKQHLLVDIIDILEHLGKADNIPFNQLYYIMENCTNRYYSKVIETFVSIIKSGLQTDNYCWSIQHIASNSWKNIQTNRCKFGRSSTNITIFWTTYRIYIFTLTTSKPALKLTLNI